MIIREVEKIFVRDLEKLKEEISLYRNEQDIWIVRGDILNSAGNLCLHLVGNLNYFIGAVLGQSGYIRNRDHEFAAKDIPRLELIEMVDETVDVVSGVLSRMSNSQLNEIYPQVVFREPMSTGYFLVHLTAHLSYHLGQINYHRRLLSRKNDSTRTHFDASIIRSWRN